MGRTDHSTRWQIALYALLCLIWGSTWAVIKVGYGGLGPFNVAAVRFLVAAAVLCLLMPVLRARWPSGRTEWSVVAVMGLVLFGGNYGLVYWAEQRIDSGLAAIVFAMLPLVSMGLAHVFIPGERVTGRALSGGVLAVVGIAALFGDHVRVEASQTWPLLAVVAATVCSSVAAVVGKRYGGTLHPAALNAPAMLVGAVALAGVSVASGDGLRLPDDTATWTAVAYLAIAGSVVSFLGYFSLLKTWSVTSLSFITVFTPVIALVIGFVLLDERPTIGTAAGAVLILAGVVLALRPTRSPTARSEERAARRALPIVRG